jgi:hypothetical protein
MLAPAAFSFPVIWARIAISAFAAVGIWAGRGLCRDHYVLLGNAAARRRRGIAVDVGCAALTVVVVFLSLTLPQPMPFGQGILQPQHDKIATYCEKTSGGIIAGTNAFQFGEGEYSLIYLDGRSIVKVQRIGEKLKLIELHIIDDNQNEIANISNNIFWISPTVRFYHPDSGTLLVNDHKGVEVFGIRYANEQNIFVGGTFNNHGESVEIDSKEMRMRFNSGRSHLDMNHNCFMSLSIIMDQTVHGIGDRPGGYMALVAPP